MPVPAPVRTRLKGLLLAFSLANLLMLDIWRQVQADSAERYFAGLHLPTMAPWILGGAMLALAFLLQSLPPLLRSTRAGRWALAGGEVVALLAILNGFRKIIAGRVPVLELNVLKEILGGPALAILVAAILALALALRFLRPGVFDRGGRAVLTLLLPLPLVLLLNLRVVGPAPGPGLAPPAIAKRPTTPVPTILFIFDEFDQGWTFSYRPAGLDLPELDRLSRSAFMADQAFPPASETIRSIPSLLSGRFLEAVQFGADSELLVRPEGARGWQRWSDMDDLASEASRRGLHTMMINHFHPLSPRYLARRPGFAWQHHFYYRQWEDQATQLGRPGGFLRHTLSSPLRLIPGWGAAHSPEQDTAYIQGLYGWMLDRTMETVKAGQTDLLIVHWPVPHLPLLLPRLRSAPAQVRTLGNLLLVDQAIGQVRRTLEACGRWDETLLMVTSDHWFRKVAGGGLIRRPRGEDLRVPLLVKLPGQSAAFLERTPLNNRVVWDLAVGAMDGIVPSPADIARLPKAQPTMGPYNPVMR